MPILNRQIINENLIDMRIKDNKKILKLGKKAFQLRLWDGRIGRWLTTDPKHEFYSPYLGMGNTPINAIDHDGGMDEPGDDCCGGFDMIGDKVVINGKRAWITTKRI